MSDPEAASRRAARHIWALGIALPAAIYITVSLMYVSAYSTALYNRSAFVEAYGHGIYRYRVLGKYLTLGVDALVQHLGVHIGTLVTQPPIGAGPWNLFTAVVLVNGAAFLASALLLYLATVQDPNWTVPYLILIVLITASMYVVDPWDALVHLLIIAAVLVAILGRPWSAPLCLLLSVAGTATHEQYFVAVAAIVALAVARPRRGFAVSRRWSVMPGKDDSLWWSALAAAGGSLGTYVALHVLLVGPGGHRTFWGDAPLDFVWAVNHRMGSAIALTIVVLGGFALLAELPRFDASRTASHRWFRRSTFVFLVLCVPYFVTSAIEGVWFEALRLVLPVAICLYLLRWAVDSGAVDVEPGSQGPVTASVPESPRSADAG